MHRGDNAAREDDPKREHQGCQAASSPWEAVRPSHGGSPVTALIEVHGYP